MKRISTTIDNALSAMFGLTLIGVTIVMWIMTFIFLFDTVTTDGVPWTALKQMAYGSVGAWLSTMFTFMSTRIVIDIIEDLFVRDEV
tara:strand:+ start:1770 stop:2030 length:261 start_codon:yes stop_codon:yes gene_type:complete